LYQAIIAVLNLSVSDKGAGAGKQKTVAAANENRHQRLDQCHEVVYFYF
jgi:hypothetical protein